MAEQVFLNDALVDANEAAVSALDSGLLYGAGLFETMRAGNGVVFRLDDHLDRLFAGAEALSVTIDQDRAYITDAIYRLLEANGLGDARLRLTATGGPMTPDPSRRHSTLLISATTLAPYPDEYYRKGVVVALSPYRQNPFDPTHGHKTTSYYSRLLALRKAHAVGAAEAVWFTVEGHLAEGCVSNVFLVRDGVVLTPPADTPVLPGVARKAVCYLAGEHGVRLEQRRLTIDDCLAAEEMFLTNVIMQVMPVRSLEKHAIGKDKPGPITQMLREKFLEYVDEQCRKRP